MQTPESFHIVVTDINHHVRDLIKRELVNEGYTVFSMKTADLIRERIGSSAPLDLLILDPELFAPYDHAYAFEIVHRRKGGIQVIIHAYEDILHELAPGDNILLVEKNGRSIEALKDTIRTCLLSSSKPMTKAKRSSHNG